MKKTLSLPIFNDEDAARAYLEAQRWPDGPVCPFCGQFETVQALPQAGSMGPGWYHCKDCRRKFTVRVGTLYERSHIPLHKWLLATHLICSSKKGISSHQLHRTLGVTYKTAWFMSHRIREGMNQSDTTPMGGSGKIVEADETLLGPTTYRHRDGRGWIGVTGHAEKMKIVALVERGGKLRTLKVENFKVTTMRQMLLANVSRDSILSTDGAPYYKRTGRELFAGHLRVDHESREYVRGDAHVNTLENFFSVFKRGMRGVYQHCGEQHVMRYVREFEFRYNNRVGAGVNDWQRTDKALKGIEGKRLTYRLPNEARA
jgi:transposase-like protein